MRDQYGLHGQILAKLHSTFKLRNFSGMKFLLYFYFAGFSNNFVAF